MASAEFREPGERALGGQALSARKGAVETQTNIDSAMPELPRRLTREFPHTLTISLLERCSEAGGAD